MTEPAPDPLEELDVEVRLDRDHQGPQLFTDTVPAGTWVGGWMRRRDWTRSGDRWRSHVHFCVPHPRGPLVWLTRRLRPGRRPANELMLRSAVPVRLGEP